MSVSRLSFYQSLKTLGHISLKCLLVMMQYTLRAYKYLISPILPVSCRFYPTCSAYALSALEHYGLMRGMWMTIKRLLRCHPWSEGGCDPVLPNEEKR